MTSLFYSLIGWTAAFCSWVLEPAQPNPRKRRQAEARRAMAQELYGRPKLVRGGRK